MADDRIEIRRIGPSEVDVFRKIRLEALRSEPAFYASSHDDWATLSDDDWRQRLDAPVFIAFLDTRPVGIMGLLRQSAGKMAHRATIIMVYICKTRRGTGLATDLLKTVIDHARDSGIRQLELSVSAENPAAIRFYLREGFVQTGRIPGGFLHEGREIDDLIMIRRLRG